MKCLEIARLQDFAPNTQGLLGALSGPQTPCRIERTPLWKFLPTGLKWGFVLIIADIVHKLNVNVKFRLRIYLKRYMGIMALSTLINDIHLKITYWYNNIHKEKIFLRNR